MSKKKILIVEDEKEFAKLLFKVLSKEFSVKIGHCLKDATYEIKNNFFNIILLDLRLPDGDGKDLIDIVKRHTPETFIIILTAYGDIEDAVDGIKRGAFYYLEKPFDMPKLIKIIFEAIRKQNKFYPLSSHLEEIEKRLIVGKSEKIKSLIKLVEKISKSNIPVLIWGETGTGKELIARTIHKLSDLKDKPFISLNCASLPKELFEEELFGPPPSRGIITSTKQGTIYLKKY